MTLNLWFTLISFSYKYFRIYKKKKTHHQAPKKNRKHHHTHEMNTNLFGITELTRNIGSFLAPNSDERLSMNETTRATGRENDAFAEYLKMYNFNYNYVWQKAKKTVLLQTSIYDNNSVWHALNPSPSKFGMIDVEIDWIAEHLTKTLRQEYLDLTKTLFELESGYMPFEWTPSRLLDYIKALGPARWMKILVRLCPIIPGMMRDREQTPNEWALKAIYTTNSRGAIMIRRIGYDTITSYDLKDLEKEYRENVVYAEDKLPNYLDNSQNGKFNDAMLMPSQKSISRMIAYILEKNPQLFSVIFPRELSSLDSKIPCNVLPFEWMCDGDTLNGCGMIYRVFQVIEQEWSIEMIALKIPLMRMTKFHIRILLSTVMAYSRSIKLVKVFQAIVGSCTDDNTLNEIMRIFATYMCGYGETLPNYDFEFIYKSGGNLKAVEKWTRETLLDQYNRYNIEQYMKYCFRGDDRDYVSPRIKEFLIFPMAFGLKSSLEKMDYLMAVSYYYYGIDNQNNSLKNRKYLVDFTETIVNESGVSELLDCLIDLASNENATMARKLLGRIWGYCDAVFDGAMTLEMKKKITKKIRDPEHVDTGYVAGISAYDRVRNYLFRKIDTDPYINTLSMLIKFRRVPFKDFQLSPFAREVERSINGLETRMKFMSL